MRSEGGGRESWSKEASLHMSDLSWRPEAVSQSSVHTQCFRTLKAESSSDKREMEPRVPEAEKTQIHPQIH